MKLLHQSLFLIMSFFSFSLIGSEKDTKHVRSVSRGIATRSIAVSHTMLAPIAGAAAAALSLDPKAPAVHDNKKKVDEKVDNGNEIFNIAIPASSTSTSTALISAPFPRRLLNQSGLLKVAIENEQVGETIQLIAARFKSVSFHELGKFLEIISAHKNKQSCIRELQAQIQMYANPEKIADICDVANYLDIPELLQAVVPMLANEVSREPDARVLQLSKFSPSASKIYEKRLELFDLFIQQTSLFDPKVQHLITRELLKETLKNKLYTATVFYGQKFSVEAIRWHSVNPTILASCSWDNTVKIWDISRKDNPCMQTIAGDTKSICNAIAWNPLNPTILASRATPLRPTYFTASPNSVGIWDTTRQDDHCVQMLDGHTGMISSIAWNPVSPTILASCSDDNTVRIWDISRKDSPCMQMLGGHTDRISFIAWNPVIPTILASCSDDNTVKIWDVTREDNPCIRTFHHTIRGAQIVWNPTNPTLFASCSADNTVRIWDLSCKDDSCIQTLDGHTEGISSIAWNPVSPSILASCARDNTVRIWDISRKNNPFMQSLDGHTEPVIAVEWHPTNPSIIASSSRDDTIKVWNIADATNPCMQTLNVRACGVLCIAWHPTNPSMLASGSRNGTTLVWDLSVLFECGKTLKELTIKQVKNFLDITTSLSIQLRSKTLDAAIIRKILSLPCSLRAFAHVFLMVLEVSEQSITKLLSNWEFYATAPDAIFNEFLKQSSNASSSARYRSLMSPACGAIGHWFIATSQE